MTPGRALVAAAVLAVVAGLALFAGSCDGAPPAPSGPLGTYTFRWAGPEDRLPWNRTVYLSRVEGERLLPPFALTFFEGELEVTADGRKGEEWFVHSEESPNRAIERILWSLKQSGRFGDETAIDLVPAPRTRLRLTGDEGTHPGDDTVSIVDEAGGARCAVVRSRLTGLRLGIWDASVPREKEDFRSTTHRAPPRPMVWTELRAATFVLAAKSEGRQWIVRRVEMKPDEDVVFDVGAAPPGGGTVLCDDIRAELLIGGLPVVPPRLDPADSRARWTGVPPGRHEVRYGDGTVVPVDVADAAEVRLPREPPR